MRNITESTESDESSFNNVILDSDKKTELVEDKTSDNKTLKKRMLKSIKSMDPEKRELLLKTEIFRRLFFEK
ncbi:MAG: hypothetical protein GF364_11785 [Candidatus Lokiarchaeota archaeon]|nr:hypothetical protein [Candidatus Lokiarchaeota archaeon]